MQGDSLRRSSVKDSISQHTSKVLGVCHRLDSLGWHSLVPGEAHGTLRVDPCKGALVVSDSTVSRSGEDGNTCMLAKSE